MQKKGRFDYILLETTGLADPGPIASMFWLDDSLGASVYLDGIITVVDAVNIHRSLDTHDHSDRRLSTAHLQISHADVVIVNKLDLISPKEREGVVQRVQSINSLARVMETTFARLETLDDILDLHAYDSAHLPMDGFNRDSSGHLDHVHSCSDRA
jgi:G3E family GTPase